MWTVRSDSRAFVGHLLDVECSVEIEEKATMKGHHLQDLVESMHETTFTQLNATLHPICMHTNYNDVLQYEAAVDLINAATTSQQQDCRAIPQAQPSSSNSP